MPIGFSNKAFARIKVLMKKPTAVLPLFLLLALLPFTGCGSSSHNEPVANPAPLSADNINLIFVVSEDLDNQAAGDVDIRTANLTGQGLHRSLLMAPFLQQKVLGNNNVTGIYALEPMTHLQTADHYPDMTGLETVQQFALLNQITQTYPQGLNSIPGNSYPLNVSYAAGPVPSEVITPSASLSCPGCQGLDYTDQNSDNETLIAGLIHASAPGFYVFSAPWKTTRSLLTNINASGQYDLALPASYQGPNTIYAISITPSGSASLATYNSNVNPSPGYPALPSPVALGNSCTMQTPFRIIASGPPETINRNQTLYMIRHANAHPTAAFSDGNYVAAGQWRALSLANALQGKIHPTHVYSLDPAQVTQGTYSATGSLYSHATLAMTVEPYAIANRLPYSLVTNFLLSDATAPQQASDYFFLGGKFNNQTSLLAWEHSNIPLIINALLSSYGSSSQLAPGWPQLDYDTVWTVKLDFAGNLTVDNSLCEGIDSKTLPATAPQF